MGSSVFVKDGSKIGVHSPSIADTGTMNMMVNLLLILHQNYRGNSTYRALHKILREGGGKYFTHIWLGRLGDLANANLA